MSEYVTRVNSDKTDAVSALQQSFSNGTDFFFADYRGMSVEQMTELRAKLRENNATFRVVKNRFAKIAFSNMEKPDGVASLLKGPTAVTSVVGESGPAAKVLFELAKDMSLSVKGGLVGGDLFDQAQLEAYSKLPTKMELISSLMGTMRAPVQNVVYVLNAVPTKLVRTLQAIADKKAQG